MKCDKHPDMDAVGTCVYCGRGVCDDCKVRMYEKIHCKECVAAGRVRGAPQPNYQPQMQYYQPYPVYAYPYYPVSNMPHREPTPVGIPDAGLFKSGMYGSLYCGIICLVNVVYTSLGVLLTTPSSMFYLVYFILYSLMLPGLLLVLRGYVGFYRNWGFMFAFQCGMVMVIAMAVDMVLWIWSYLATSPAGTTEYGYIAGVVTFGIVLMFAGVPLEGVSRYLSPMSEIRNMATWGCLLMALGGILFWFIFGAFIFGWALGMLAFFMMSQVFAKAPVPTVAEPPKHEGIVMEVIGGGHRDRY